MAAPHNHSGTTLNFVNKGNNVYYLDVNGILARDITENIVLTFNGKERTFNTKSYNKQKITINDETETFILNGCGNTFNNLLIESNASFTVVNNIKLNSSAGTPLKISSPIVQLGKVELNSSGISLELNNDCILELYGESSVVSGTGNAVLCKNVELAKTEDAIKNGVYSEINVSKNLLVFK